MERTLEYYQLGLLMLRERLPFLAHVDDTGVLVGGYLVLAVVAYLSAWMFVKQKRPDALDRRALFDSQTRIRELSVEIQHLRAEQPTAEQLGELDELRRRCDEQSEALRSLQAAAVDPTLVDEKQAEIERLQREHAARLTAIGHDRKTESQQRTDEIARLKREIREKEELIASLRAERDALREKLSERSGNRHELDAKYTELTAKHDRLVQVIADQKSQMAAVVIREENAETAALHRRSAVRSASTERDDPNATLTGERKSAGRESKLPLPKAPAAKWTAAELEDLAAARAELRRVEAERDQVRRQLHAANLELESLREQLREANALKAKLDQKEQQMAEMLQMIKDKDQRLAKVADMQEDMFETDAKRVRAETKAVDLQESLRRTEEEQQKLRNQWYHDERRLNAKIRSLEEIIDQFRAAHPQTLFGKPLGASSPTFGTRDYSDAPDGRDVPDLWSPFNNKQ
ncbi:hypothetical protein M3Y99_00675500 [Aphelenchoides fujianensis]|nr:hypothetical protein M3Y99_00675500 [Aphelenchoides fujianensis]